MLKLSGFLGAIGVVASIAASPPPVALAHSPEPGVANFLTAVNTIRDEMDALGHEKKLSPNDFRFANLNKLTNPGNAAVLAKAIQKHTQDIHELREALGRNAVVAQALAKASIPVDEVVALDVEPGSGITVYYQPAG